MLEGIYAMTKGMLIFYVWITATKCSSENDVSLYKSEYHNNETSEAHI